MLHIHNGDSAAGTARRTNLVGEHLVWREALICGPAPATDSAEEFQETRARHLSEAYGESFSDCLKNLREQETGLENISAHEEVVLWFEHDLFCQLHLVFLLNWFAQHELGKTRLSLVSIDRFAGIQDFRGLGQLNEAQLESLFPARQEISHEQLELGSQVWRAYISSDPGIIESILQDGHGSALPFMKTAMLKHLQRFPSSRNGLGAVENCALDLIAAGTSDFKTLFPAFCGRQPIYGFGDAQLCLALRGLAEVSVPLLKVGEAEKPNGPDWRELRQVTFQPTEAGEAVLRGEADFIELNGIDRWLGGVHLKGPYAEWRWDERLGRLVQS